MSWYFMFYFDFNITNNELNRRTRLLLCHFSSANTLRDFSHNMYRAKIMNIEQNRTEMVLQLNYYSCSWYFRGIQLFTMLVTKQGVFTMDELCVMI